MAPPARDGRDGPDATHGTDAPESPELQRLRGSIDAIDRRIVELLNERAELAREVGREKTQLGRRAVRDTEREREVLLRVTMANGGPMPQADLLAIYRRLIASTRALEERDRRVAREMRDRESRGEVDAPER